VPCETCHGPCRSLGIKPSSNGLMIESRDDTPLGTPRAASPIPKKKDDNGTYYDCLGCGHPIAYNRYAPHLSSCLGLTGRARNAKRTTHASRLENGSPYVSSDEEAFAKDKKKKIEIKSNGKKALSNAIHKVAKKYKTSTPPPTRVSSLVAASQMSRSTSSPLKLSNSQLPVSQLSQSTLATDSQSSTGATSPSGNLALTKAKSANDKGEGSQSRKTLPDTSFASSADEHDGDDSDEDSDASLLSLSGSDRSERGGGPLKGQAVGRTVGKHASNGIRSGMTISRKMLPTMSKDSITIDISSDESS